MVVGNITNFIIQKFNFYAFNEILFLFFNLFGMEKNEVIFFGFIRIIQIDKDCNIFLDRIELIILIT